MIDVTHELNFLGGLRAVQKMVHQTATDKGFWEEDWSPEKKILLMHSEISEAAEILRDGDKPYEKNPDFSEMEMEMADTVIRVMDFCEKHNFDLAGAILAKNRINMQRPRKHGRKF